jgi:Ni2+-binding GTPase involved in maturation of urease and hydrogenase
MALLHYQNIEPNIHRPDMLINMTVHGLRDFYTYLDHTKKYLESDVAVLRLAWKPGSSEKGCWIELIEDRPDEPETTFQAFLDDSTGSVYQAEAPKGQGWTFHKKEQISILDRELETNQLLLEKQPDKPVLLLKPNTYPLQKQMEAIRRLQDTPLPEHRPLLKLMETTTHVEWPNLPNNWQVQDDWKLLTESSRPGTDKQRDFVNIALNTPDFAFLEGPPGSGKTTAICELILQLIAQDKRILLCASTHVAVDNVIERLMDSQHHEQVIPIRIGDKSILSDSVKPYQFEEFCRTEKKRLMNFLSQQNPPSQAQRHLLQAIKNQDETLTTLILESANVVCGTTIGILQHPQIKDRNMANPLFDMLIIDEASKTQFQEFIVPALLAKRWILIGDPRQLSPYVDDEAMAENVKVCLPDPVSREICLDVFQAKHYPNSGAVLIATDEQTKYQQQAKAHKVLFANAQSDPLSLATASIVADTPTNFATCEAALPLDITTLRGNTENLHLLKRRVAAFKKQPAEDKNWANEIAWRQARLYEQRQSQGNQGERLQTQINDLLPVFENHERVQWKIEQIRRIALPSVLESLQNGFERRKGQKTGTALSDGLAENALKQRHILLEYQHRMHPEISQFSRTYIYQGAALQNPPDMTKLRHWEYDRYAHRAVWLDVWPKKGEKGNCNSQEVGVIQKEIQAFHQWAKQNPHPENKVWTVAILSFYRRQEKFLRKACRELSGQHRAYRNFYLGGNKQKHDVHLEVCTVDRFQGHEADLVFLSFVKNHPTVFLASPNRLNVAVTRGRYQLVLVGNHKRLSNNRYTELKALVDTVPITNTWS